MSLFTWFFPLTQDQSLHGIAASRNYRGFADRVIIVIKHSEWGLKLSGCAHVSKRCLIRALAFSLNLLLRMRFGVLPPRQLLKFS